MCGPDRGRFSCGIDLHGRYLKTQATQDFKRHVAASFVLLSPDNQTAGFYTLSAFSVNLPELPPKQARRLPKHPAFPATLIGRLAVDRKYCGMRLGKHLLMDALFRSYGATTQVASYAVVVDAKNDAAIAFYKKYDFILFTDHPNRLFLPMRIIESLF